MHFISQIFDDGKLTGNNKIMLFGLKLKRKNLKWTRQLKNPKETFLITTNYTEMLSVKYFIDRNRIRK